MSNEKQTDSLHWKNKLSNLDSLPEESVTKKNAAWEKLHDRLHEKTHRNKIAWYWIAAACIIFPALTILWMMTNKKDNPLVQIPLQEKQQSSPVTYPPVIHKDPFTILSPSSAEKNQSVKNAESNLVSNKNAPGKSMHVKREDPLVANTNTVIEKTPEPAINSVPSTDTVASVKTVAVVKTKLRVVHINELEAEPASNNDHIALSIKPEQNNFKFRLRNIHPVNSPVTPRQEYAALKIPLTN